MSEVWLGWDGMECGTLAGAVDYVVGSNSLVAPEWSVNDALDRLC